MGMVGCGIQQILMYTSVFSKIHCVIVDKISKPLCMITFTSQLLLLPEKEILRTSREKNETRRSKAMTHEEKKRRIKAYIEEVQLRMAQKQNNLQQLNDSTGNIRRQHIKDLLEYIFPLEEIKPKRQIALDKFLCFYFLKDIGIDIFDYCIYQVGC